ncbi:SprT-like domain-containing protein [uncultured Amnibacterium sp.]|uniref:SprT-like domain-containing protein n=1 Tax=uncultured Amnibacterium sp. TaxID=1631851 RepID=UPI0035CC848A
MAELHEVSDIAQELLAAHLSPGGWTFGFDQARRRAGACDYAKRRITVSRHLAAGFSADDARQVLLHEIAHAIAGHTAAHGPRWKAVAARLGYTGDRVWRGEVQTDAAPWIGSCPAGHEHHRFRRPSGTHSCGRCSKRFSSAALIIWRHRSAVHASG